MIAFLFYLGMLIVAFLQTSSEQLTVQEVSLALLSAIMTARVGIAILRRGKVITIISWAPFFIFLWAPLNIFWAMLNGVDPIWSFRRSAPLVAFSLTATATVLLIRSRSLLHLTFAVVTLGASLSVIIRLTTIHELSNVYFQDFRRISGVMGGYYSVLATTLTFPCAFFRIPPRSIVIRLLAVSGVSVGLAGIIFSFTRTYWIVGSLGLCFLILLARGRLGWLSVAFLIFAGFTASLISSEGMWKQLSASILERIQDLNLSELSNDPSLLNRLNEIYAAVRMVLAEPQVLLLGRGIGRQLMFYSVNPFDPRGFGEVSTDYLHNFYLYLLVQTGVPGLMAIGIAPMLVAVRALAALLKSNHYEDFDIYSALAVSILGVAVSNLVAPPMLHTGSAVHLGALMGLLCTSEELIRKSGATAVGLGSVRRNYCSEVAENTDPVVRQKW